MGNELKLDKRLITINIIAIIFVIAYVVVSRIYFTDKTQETGTYKVEQEQSLIEFKGRQKQGYTILINEVEYSDVSNINKVINNYDITIDNDNKHIIMVKKPDNTVDNHVIPVVVPIQY